MSKNMAIFPTIMDLTRSNLSVVTANGTTADWMRKGKMKRGKILEMRSFLRPRPLIKTFIVNYRFTVCDRVRLEN